MSKRQPWQGDLEQVRRAHTARGRAQSGTFVIEGVRLHERALRAGRTIEMALIAESLPDAAPPRLEALLTGLAAQGTRLVPVPDAVIRAQTGGRGLGAILGLLPIPADLDLGELLGDTEAQSPLFLVATDIKEPGNVGALARTAHAAGATALITTGDSDPYHPKALRTSMGSLLKLPVVRMPSALAAVALLQAGAIRCLGMAASGGVPLPRLVPGERGTAVFAGNEAWGLRDAVQAALDQLVTIPMAEGVDSFSVNAAAAIVLYEIRRPRFVSRSAVAPSRSLVGKEGFDV